MSRPYASVDEYGGQSLFLEGYWRWTQAREGRRRRHQERSQNHLQQLLLNDDGGLDRGDTGLDYLAVFDVLVQVGAIRLPAEEEDPATRMAYVHLAMRMDNARRLGQQGE